MWVCPQCGESQEQSGACSRDGANLAQPTPGGLHGITIGNYRVARILGVGGMGEVYLGVHPDIGSRVAIKVLASECVKSPELVERFFTEARTVNRIRHENIINVLDMGALPDRRPYIVMEYIDGQPMGSVNERYSVWPLGTLARLAGEILDALGAAHRTGVVHRDLKPDNIFITPNAHAKVLDFGIAKLLPEYGGGGSATQTGMLLGTPAYMAPEQVTGGAVTGRTDIYALGVMLYEASTGQQPIRGETLLALLTKIAHEVPPSPRSLRPEMPPAYEAVILHAMAKQAENRYASALDMAMALKDAAADLPPPAWASISAAGSARVTIGPHSTGKGSQPPLHPPTPPHHQLATSSTTPAELRSPPSLTQKTPKKRPLGLAVAVVLLGAVLGAAIIFAVKSGGKGATTKTAGKTVAPTDDAATTMDAGAVALTGPDATPASSNPTDPPRRPPLRPNRTVQPDNKQPAPAVAKNPGKTAKSIFDPKTSKVIKDASGTTVIIGGPPANNRIKLQPDYNPRRFDARAYLPRARKLARTIFSDAKLVHFDVGGVLPNGYANLTLGGGMEATYWYRSRSRSGRPKSAPVGVEVEIKCMIYVIASASRVSVYPRSFEKCNQRFRPTPRCTLAQVWKKAITLKAPKNAVAQIDYLWDGWYFQIKGTSFSESIKDDC